MILVIFEYKFLVDGVLIVKQFGMAVSDGDAFGRSCACKNGICAIFLEDSFHFDAKTNIMITVVGKALILMTGLCSRLVIIGKTLTLLSPLVLIVVVLLFKWKDEP